MTLTNKDMIDIKWNDDKFGVEIKTNDEHFVISAKPSMVMSWDDAMRYFKDDAEWKLPTIKQLELVSDNLDEINSIIKVFDGYYIHGGLWSCETQGKLRAWLVYMFYGSTSSYYRCGNFYVRAVSALN